MDKSVCIVVSSMMTVKAFLLDHIAALNNRCSISVVANTDERGFFKDIGLHARIIPIRIERKIIPWLDIKAFFYLLLLFRRQTFDMVYSVTPKAGLLAMTAGFAARIPVRVHTFTGQVWATRKGLSRWVLKQADRLIALSATNILVDSHSQREFLIQERIFSRDKSSVLANGSICGVDKNRFRFDKDARRTIREKEGIREEEIVFLYIGRLNKDKGLLDLADAFAALCRGYPLARLMIIGPDEGNMQQRIGGICAECSDRLHFAGYTDVPQHYMSAADILCLPSYREGFGNVVIEAASVGIPSIGTRIYGVTDAIEEGITGFLHKAGDVADLCTKMATLANDRALIRRLGKAAHTRAVEYYSKDLVTSAMVEYCDSLMKKSTVNRDK